MMLQVIKMYKTSRTRSFVMRIQPNRVRTTMLSGIFNRPITAVSDTIRHRAR
jgi:hypothetical protein